MDIIWGILVLGVVGYGFAMAAADEFGGPNSKVICDYCGVNAVRVSDVTRKTGISGGKATGAFLTGGVSMLATGLSQKQGAKHLACRNCGMEWDVF